MEDLNIGEFKDIVCKVCLQIKRAFFAGRTGTMKKDKKWVDENKRLFNGKTCPDCHAKKVLSHYKQKRVANESKTGNATENN